MEPKQGFPTDTGRVLDVLSFIEYHVLPFDALEILLVLRHLKSNEGEAECQSNAHKLITRDENVERRVLIVTNLLLTPEFAKRSAILDVTPIWQRFQIGHETSEFLLPVMKGGRGSDNKKWSPYVMRFSQV